jgi:hypothetical protein
MRNWKAGSVEPAHTRDLLLSIRYKRRINGLLRLEHGVNALGWNDRFVLEGEDKGRILTVKHDDVHLLAELAPAVDDMSLRRLISLREIPLKEVDPDMLARIPLRARMRKTPTHCCETTLNVLVERRQELAK